ncbi:MAG: hypothetical protein ACI4LC_04315 [Emergencia sp.]
MSYFSTVLSEEIRRQRIMLSRAREELKNAPAGRMKSKVRKHRISFYHAINGKEINITGDTKTIHSLLMKYVNRTIVRTASLNLSAMDKLIKNYCANDYASILEMLPVSYSRANTSIFRSATATQNKFLYSPDTHIHETVAGIFVRSKSEVIIANTLTNYGIPFSYEYRFPVLTKEGKKIYPDFKIVCADGLIIIWEHWGLLDQIDYCISQAYKLNAYNNQGYVLGQNLIITADDNHGGCNAQQIDQIVRTLILPHMGI